MTRAEKVAEAQRLRAGGLTYREIGERMGVPLTTASCWVLDPLLSSQRARRRSYGGTCSWCDGPMDGSRGYVDQRPGRICQDCRNWDEASVIDAIRRWGEEHGGIPPREIDFRDAPWPHPNSVRRRFGRWNHALRAAGFGVHQDKSPERQAWIEKQLRAGVPTRRIADALGVTPAAIHVRMRYRGTTVEAIRRSKAPA